MSYAVTKPNRAATPRDLVASPGAFLGLGLGSGLSPVAPGTFGTLLAVPLYIAAISAGFGWYVVITLIMIVTGGWICGHTAKILDSHDHPAIVWDEFAGYFVTMLLVPGTYVNILGGFILFRLFDIVKPWPIRWIDQKVHGGLGIMLDDLIAGVFAGAILWALQYLDLWADFSSILPGNPV